MAGHSKWHNIKRKKEATDAKKGKIFTRMSRLIEVAARQGGGDPDTNPALRLVVDKAKHARMPKDNIDRAIKKGTGQLGSSSLEEVTYEGYGPSGVALVVKTVTDNRNRTVAEIKTIFGKNSGSLGVPGSTSYIFDSEGVPSFTVPLSDSDKNLYNNLFEALDDHQDVVEIYTNLEE